MAVITKRKIVPTAKLTGRANALTRGQGNKFGLKRKMGIPTGSKPSVPPIVKPPTPPGTAPTAPQPRTMPWQKFPADTANLAIGTREEIAARKASGLTQGTLVDGKMVYSRPGPRMAVPMGAKMPRVGTTPKSQFVAHKGTGGSVLTKAIAAATAKRKLTGRANALTRGRGKKIGLRRLPVRRSK